MVHVFHVDDLKFSHEELNESTKMLIWMEGKYVKLRIDPW